MTFKHGDLVEITDGPYSGQQGSVEHVYGDEPESFIRVCTVGGAVLVLRRLLRSVTLPVESSYDDSLWGY